MRSFSELTRREQLIEIARWICVLPAAVLGDIGMSVIIRAVVQLIRYGGSGILSDMSLGYRFGLLLSYGLPQAACVIAGAKMAPRQQVTSSVVLAVLGLGLSLMTHVVGQQLAGNRVGIVNYMHVCAQSAGLLSSMAWLVIQQTRNRRKGIAPFDVTTASTTSDR